jgi:uncharacterized membrane protein
MSEDCNSNYNNPSVIAPKTTEDWSKLVNNMIENHADQMTASLKAMNIQACSYSKGEVKTLFGLASADAQTAVGCEQIALQAQMQVALTKVVNCSLQQSKSTIKNSTIQSNKIVLEFDQDVTDSQIKISQLNSSAGTIYNFSNTELQAKVSSDIKTALDSISKSFQDTKNGPFSDPTAQKSIEDQISVVQNSLSNTSVENIVTTTINAVVQNNGTRIIYKGNVLRSTLNFDQVNSNQFVISNIVSNIMDNVFDNKIKNDIKNDEDNKQTQANKGIGGMLGGFIVIALIAVGIFAYMFMKGKNGFIKDKSCSTTGLLKAANIVCAILVVFGVIMYIVGFLFDKKKWKTYGIIFAVIGILFVAGAIAMTIYMKKNCNSKNKGNSKTKKNPSVIPKK